MGSLDYPIPSASDLTPAHGPVEVGERIRHRLHGLGTIRRIWPATEISGKVLRVEFDYGPDAMVARGDCQRLEGGE